MAAADFTGDSPHRMLASKARTLATSSKDIKTEKAAEVHNLWSVTSFVINKNNGLQVDESSGFVPALGSGRK